MHVPFIRAILWLSIALLTFLEIHGTSSSSSPARASSVTKFPLPGVIPDPFIAAAPLILGVVCKDAVFLLALHTAFSTESKRNAESFLLYRDSQELENHTDTNPTVRRQIDLPRSYRGPFRIYPLDTSGTMAMACAGWRTDGQRLAEYIQMVDKREHEMFGESLNGKEHGNFLACTASQMLANVCVSEGRRPLSCLGLLAAAGDTAGNAGYLWLVDATGAYRVRAHAVGGGTLAGQINGVLRDKDWTRLECNDVARELLLLLFPGTGDDHSENTTKIDTPQGCLVEMVAICGTNKKLGRSRKIKRLFSSTLFGQTRH